MDLFQYLEFGEVGTRVPVPSNAQGQCEPYQDVQDMHLQDAEKEHGDVQDIHLQATEADTPRTTLSTIYSGSLLKSPLS